MTLRHLEIFLEVANLGSMTKAADKLNMSQPAISMTIRELEDYYNTKLFDRMNRRLYLTHEGETLKSYSESIMHKYHEVYALLNEHNLSTQFNIGVNISLGETLLSSIIQTLNQIEQIDYRVTVENNQSIITKIENNQLDFALVDQLSDSSNIQYLPYMKDEMEIVVKKGYNYHIKQLDDLLKYPLLLREKGSGNRSCVDIVFDVYDLKADPFVESSSDLAILNLVKNGLGIAILPSKLIESYGDDLEVIHLKDIHFIRHFYIIYSTKKYLTSVILKTIEHLLSERK